MARIQLTDKMHSKLLELEKLSGIGPYALVYKWDDKPEGLSATTIDNWLKRRVKSVSEVSYKAVIKYWEHQEPIVKITPEIQAALIAEQQRTNMKAQSFIKFVGQRAHPNLNQQLLDNWVSGKRRSVSKSLYHFVMDEYAKVSPDDSYNQRYKNRKGYVEVTPEIREDLNHLRTLSGIGPARLLRGRQDIPENLHTTIIDSWLSGRSNSAKATHLDYVLKIWREVDPLIDVTALMQEELRQQLERTAMTPLRYARIFPERPKGLSPRVMSELAHLKRKRISQNIWGFLLQSLQSLPDKQVTIKKPYLSHINKQSSLQKNKDGPKRKIKTATAPDKKPYISRFSKDLRTISSEELNMLRDMIARTGVTPTELLRRFPQDVPEKLGVSTINQWLNKKIKRTSPERIAWVLEKYAQIENLSTK